MSPGRAQAAPAVMELQGAARGSSGAAPLPSEAINCSLWAAGVLAWAHCSPGLDTALMGSVTSRHTPLLFLCPPGRWHSCRVTPSCHQCQTFPCSRAMAGLSLPPQGFFGGSGEKFISDPVPSGSPLFLGTVNADFTCSFSSLCGFPSTAPSCLHAGSQL